MKKAKRIAIAGATGMVGQAFQNLLEKNFFPEAENRSACKSKIKRKIGYLSRKRTRYKGSF